MSILEMHVIDLLEADDSILKETKISSSSRRREALDRRFERRPGTGLISNDQAISHPA